MSKQYRVLIMGASYGSLLATKLGLAGHSSHLICLPAEAELINTEGAIIRMPVKGREGLVEVNSRALPGKLTAGGPAGVRPADFDLVVLAMQEPQYRSPGVRELLDQVARSRVPCMSIMNMPPLPFLKRIPEIDAAAIRDCYTDASVWDSFDPATITLCSPDPQAFRPPEDKVNVLQVRLPTNFKWPVSFGRVPRSCARCRRTSKPRGSRSAGTNRVAGEAQGARVGVRSVGEVVDAAVGQLPLRAGRWDALDQGRGARRSRDHARGLQLGVRSLRVAGRRSGRSGAVREVRRQAAMSLVTPSSAARALANGAPNIERVDRLVQTIAAARGKRLEAVDRTVALVDGWLKKNREKAA